jgi:FtsP/CotA-like multicopper oxidase with cupredoxin domain
MSRFASDKKGSSTGWYIAAVVIIVIIIVIGVLSYELTLPKSPSTSPSPTASPTPTPTSTTSPSPGASPTPTPSSTPSGTIDLTLYAGSVSTSTYGYGNSANDITSPGPTLKLKSGQTYTMTVHNVGNIAHSWEIVSTKAFSSSPLFGAGININNYIQPGQSASVTFTPDQTGNFYYVCTVPGHIQLGMWGNVEIS